MKRLLDRLFLLATALLAAYQIAFGFDGTSALALWAYTIAFGVLLVAALLLLIFGLDVLDNRAVVIVAALIPLSLSVGLVAQYFPPASIAYTIFALVGFGALALSRFLAPPRLATIILAAVHGFSGLVIFLLPIWLSVVGRTPPAFVLVGVGGGLIGLGGLLLAFLRLGRPLLRRETIFAVLPGLLLAMTAAFVAGFAAG